jgi:N-acetylmuramoyl-L-alanine amidase
MSRWLIGCLLLANFCTIAGEPVAVKNVRVWQAPDNTRVVLDLSAAPQFDVKLLSDPYRLMVDIKDAKLLTSLAGAANGNRLISKVRESTPSEKSDLRLVLELNADVQHKAFALKPFQQYGDRLVIDLIDKSKKVIEAPITEDERDVIVAVDAGHGGDDPGAIGPKKTYEKNVTLAIAKKLAAQINTTPGMKAVLTRSGDYFVPLRKRTDIARKQKADLFVSIHADSFKDKTVRGASVWALSHKGAQNEIGRWLEEKENASDLLGGEESLDLASYDDDVAKVLLDLSMYNAVGSSLDVGASVLDSIKGVVPKLHKPRVQQAGFMVLKNPDIPAILVETAFLSNPAEEKLLLDVKHQDKLALAILKGVKTYFDQNAPEGSKLAAQKNKRQSGGSLLASKSR